MESLRSRLPGSKKKGAVTPTTNLGAVPTDSTEASPSPSVLNGSIPRDDPKKRRGASIRGLFSAKKQSSKKQPPEIVVKDSHPVQPNATIDESETLPQAESLLTRRLDVDLPEDPNHQRKLDALDYSIEVLGLFDELAKVLALVVPDALGLALGKITGILERLKKMIENKQAWKELLISIDGRQKVFNDQLVGVQAHELSPRLVGAMKQYAEALEKLAAKVMEQAGVLEKGSPKDTRFVRIKAFVNRFRNADSDVEDINEYKGQLTAVTDEFQTALTLYTAVTVNRIDRKTDNLKALIFLEGASNAPDRTVFGTKHKTCLSTTRVDVLQAIRDWNNINSEKSVYCIADVAGTGKSTIAYTMAEEWRARGYFSFFFSDTATQAAQLCISLAKQIIGSCHSPDWDDYWSKLSTELSSPTSQSVKNLWDKLVSQPLIKCTEHRCHNLVVDGLDECDKATRGPLLECMLKDCTLASQSQLRLLLTTRKEDDIRALLEMETYSKTILLISLLDSPASLADVTRYVEYRLNEDNVQLTVAQRDRLVERCGKLFIFASLACDLLRDECGDDQQLLLQDILEEFTSLDALYHRTLSQAESSSKYRRDRLMNILRVILVARGQVSISTIAALLSVSADSVRTLAKRLGSIVGSGTIDQPVYILHATFAEFLLRRNWTEKKKDPQSGLEKEKERENPYYISKPESNRAVLKGCLSNIMVKELEFNICRLETSCILNDKVKDMGDRIDRWISDGLRYSCLQWADHLESTIFDEEIFKCIQKFMHHQFLFWLEVLSVTKRVGLAPRMLSLLIEWTQINHRVDAMAKDMYKFVTTFASVIAQSAPHIYLSALPFAPWNSSVSTCYLEMYPRTLIIQSGGYSDWPSVQNISLGHTEMVTSVAFSPDGTHIVSGSSDNTVRLWDAATGEAVGEPFEGHTNGVTSVAFSADGTRIVSGSYDNTVRLWDATTGEAVGEPFKGHSYVATSVAFSPDGTRIVSGSYDNTVRLWDATTGDAVGEPFEGHTNGVMSVAFSPDGTRIVSGSNDTTIRLWDATTGEAVGEPFEGHTTWVSSVAFSPDGTRIVSGSYDETVRLWDATTGEAVGEPFEGHTNWVSSVAFSPDGTRIVSGSYDKTVRLWDATTGEAVGGPFEGHATGVTSIAFSPDGTRIVSGSYDNTVRLWDATTGEAVGEPFEGHTNGVMSVAFSPDGTRIVSGSYDKTVRLWDATTGEAVGEPFEGHTDWVSSVAFSPDGTRIVSSSNDTTVRLWDATTGEAVGEPFEGHTDWVSSVAFSPDGTRIVSGSNDTTVRLWDATTGEAVGEPFEGHTDWVSSVAFSPDGTRIVSGSGSGDMTVRLWDATTGEAVGEPFEGHTDGVTSVAFSPDGTRIVSGSYDNTVRLCDATTGEAVGEPFDGHTDWVSSVAFSPDGMRIVSGSSDKTVRVWDATTGEAVGEPFEGHTDEVMSVAFSPDGTRIVSSSNDTTVRLWDATTGKAVGEPVEGHSNAVTSVAFSPDGKRIASGSGDMTGRLRETTTGRSNDSWPFTSTMTDGWLMDTSYEPLFWVPPHIRTGLLRTGTILVMGRVIKTTLDLKSFEYGKAWTRCRARVND